MIRFGDILSWLRSPVEPNLNKYAKITVQVVIKILNVSFLGFQLMKNKVLEDLSVNLLNMKRALMKYRSEICFAFQRIQRTTYLHINQVKICRQYFPRVSMFECADDNAVVSLMITDICLMSVLGFVFGKTNIFLQNLPLKCGLIHRTWIMKLSCLCKPELLFSHNLSLYLCLQRIV